MDKPAATDHPIHDLLTRRWSPRAFQPQSVPAAQIRSMLEAARWAASSFNEQPWRFLVARREETAEFERMLACLTAGNRRWAANASLLILTVAKRTFSHNDKPNRCAVHDIGLAVANLTVQATAFGLSVHQMAGVELDTIRETYAIPEGFDPFSAVAVGIRGDAADLPDELQAMERAPRERKAQDEIVFAESWDNPASW